MTNATENRSENRSEITYWTIENILEMIREPTKPFNVWESHLISAVFVLISILGLFGNGLVIFAVLRRKEMRTNRNLLIMNLAVADFLLAATLVLFIRLPQLSNDWRYGEFLCKFYNAFAGINTFCPTITVVVIAADRYYAVTKAQLP